MRLNSSHETRYLRNGPSLVLDDNLDVHPALQIESYYISFGSDWAGLGN